MEYHNDRGKLPDSMEFKQFRKLRLRLNVLPLFSPISDISLSDVFLTLTFSRATLFLLFGGDPPTFLSYFSFPNLVYNLVYNF